MKARFYTEQFHNYIPTKDLNPDESVVIYGYGSKKLLEDNFKDYALKVDTGEWISKASMNKYIFFIKKQDLDVVSKVAKKEGILIKYDKLTYKLIEDEDGYLFAGWNKERKTKIKPEDLPEYYVKTNHYKKKGYARTKGVYRAEFIPSKWKKDGLKDDCLILSFDKNCTKDKNIDNCKNKIERYYGTDIIDIAEGVKKYSGIDLTDKVQKRVEEIKDYLKNLN